MHSRTCLAVLWAAVVSLPAQSWTQESPPVAPPARAQHSLTTDLLLGRAVLFGGNDATGWLGDTWLWDGSAWQQQPLSAPPSARHRHATVTSGSGVLLFGGSDALGSLGDLWVFSAGSWQRMAATAPPARFGHAMAYDAARGEVVLFGGSNGALLGDTWLFDGAQWRQASMPVAPSPREEHAMAYDALRQRVVLTSGTDQAGILNDTWEWDGTVWQQRSTTTGRYALADAGMAYDPVRRRVIAVGRAGFAHDWDGSRWRRISTLGGPPSRRGHGVASAADGQGILLFGGVDSANAFLADTWSLRAPSYVPFGTGCGLLPLPALSALDLPRIGRILPLQLDNVGLFRAGVLLFGQSSQTWGNVSLPQSLAAFGAPGCTLYVTPDVQVPFATTVTPSVRLDFPIPASPTLVGAVFYNQFAVAEPLANPLGLAMSDAAQATILGLTPGAMVETFDNDLMLDRAASSGSWAAGVAIPGTLGGDGLLGAFDPAVGRQLSANLYEWSTDNQVIPASHTLSGRAETVTDGVFRFARFDVPAGVTVRFVGSNPARILVRGAVDVQGIVQANGRPLPGYSGTASTGQPGGAGGPGGGAGGAGADQATSNTNQPRFDGQPGDLVRLPAGHGYAAQAAGTGGQGSPQYPQAPNVVTFNGVANTFSAQLAAGGGGGGFATAGQPGQALKTNNRTAAQGGELGPNGPGGVVFNLFPIPAGALSSEHFAVGGSGGGGGGSHAFFALKPVAQWRAGAAGAGGGGVLAVRAGHDLAMGAGGVVSARGGNGSAQQSPPPAPGGGGSGGSVLLQTAGQAVLGGTVDVRGGSGGFAVDNTIYFIETRGGDGAPGFVRLETPQANPPVSLVGATLPPAGANNVGTLAEQDDRVGSQSLWYASGLGLPPTWVRYTMDVIVNGAPVRFSDDRALGMLAGPGQPVEFYVQGGKVDPVTGQVDPATITPWRQYVGGFGSPSLSGDGATGFRFAIVFDRSLAGSIQVDTVRVEFRG